MTNQMRYRGNLYGKFTGPGTVTGKPTAAIWDEFPLDRANDFDVAGFSALYDGNDLSTKVQDWILTADTTTEAQAGSDTQTNTLTVDAADNKFGGISLVNDRATASTTSGLLCFEARFHCDTAAIAAGKLSIFAGLIDGAPALANPQADGGATITAKSVGFFKDAAATTAVDAVSFGGAQEDVKLGAATLAASTFIQLGLKLDPVNQVMRYFVNGTELSETSALSGANFPNDVNLRPAIVAASATTSSPGVITIDWIRVGQINP